MMKIIKMLVLALLLVIMGRIGYRYYKQSNWRIGSLSGRAREIAKKGFEKSMGLVGVGEPTIKKTEAKLSLTPTPPPPSSGRPSTLAESINTPPSSGPTIRPVAPDSLTNSPIQTAPQKGYCYIGTDRGYRSCIHVNQRSACMSGQLFPTKAVCVSPTLRAGMPRSAGWYYYQNGQYRLNSNPSPDYDFDNFYDMAGATPATYNGGNSWNAGGNYNNTANGGGSTTSMSQYIAQQDRNVQYGGRGESMGLTTSQSQPSSMLYSS